jgi:hypothetical protein
MPLRDRPDFQDWLVSFEARHAGLHRDDPEGPAEVCDGCGDRLESPISSADLCIVCLAETYGRERGQAAGRIAGRLEAMLDQEGRVPPADVRDAVEEVLERYEGEDGQRDG